MLRMKRAAHEMLVQVFGGGFVETVMRIGFLGSEMTWVEWDRKR
jgi:hypothetical protein